MPTHYAIPLGLLVVCLTGATSYGQVRGFGPVENKKPVVGFGKSAELAAEITAAEWEFTVNYMKNRDRNKSGALERNEMRHFSDEKFKRWDLDNDGRISIYEKTLEGIGWREQAARGRRLQRETRTIDGVEVTAADRRSAQYTMRRFDKNKNGMIDANEMPKSWRTTILQDTDRNKDGRISLREMQSRVALNRLAGSKRRQRREKNDHQQNERLNQCWELAAELIRRNDRNKDGALDRFERRAVGRDIEQADTNLNRFIDRTELSDWLAGRLAAQPGKRLPQGAPEWFVEKDKNYDGQLVMSEFASAWDDKTAAQFRKYDNNHDGVITARESLAASSGKERFVSDVELVIEPRYGVSSEILIRQDYLIGDVDLQLSISHSGPEQLDAFLIGPTGEKVELFTGKGKRWRGRNFEDTILDDEAEKWIGASHVRPPFRGSLQPDGAAAPSKKSLNAFYGTPVRGTWRLFVRATRSNRPGILHGWALHVQPAAVTGKSRNRMSKN